MDRKRNTPPLQQDWGACVYKVMPFELKNDGVTYQKLVDKIFPDQ